MYTSSLTRLLIELLLSGLAILVVAILSNICAKALGLPTWYDYLGEKRENKPLYLLWLFIAYPFMLGLTGYLAKKLLTTIG